MERDNSQESMDRACAVLKRIQTESPEFYDRIQEVLKKADEAERYYYILGVEAGLEWNDKKTYLFESIEQAVKKVHTKYIDKILTYLYENGKSYHGDLASAAEIDLSDSGLTAVMKKIDACSIPVIEKSREGKYTVYGLTREGTAYVKTKLQSKNENVSHKHETITEKKVINEKCNVFKFEDEAEPDKAELQEIEREIERRMEKVIL